MTVKANWHLAPPVEQVGQPLPLAAPEDLQLQVIALLNQEAALDAAGVRCEIKDRGDTCCHACPLNGSLSLCELGMQQERVLTQLAVDARPR